MLPAILISVRASTMDGRRRQIQTCNGTKTVTPPNDVVICNGQLREASNDNPSGGFEAGGVTMLAMYPKQPFDFAGRTGTVSFDISNDSHGSACSVAGVLVKQSSSSRTV